MSQKERPQLYIQLNICNFSCTVWKSKFRTH